MPVSPGASGMQPRIEADSLPGGSLKFSMAFHSNGFSLDPPLNKFGAVILEEKDTSQSCGII